MTSDDLGLPRIPVQAAEGKPLRHLAWADMPAYGKLDFLQLREAVSEAIFGGRHHLGGFQASHYAGHQKVEGINYNSLNRIVTAFVSAALSAEGSATIAAARKPELMPIDSAPKDGTRFLAYERGRHFDCWWHYYAADQGYGWRDDADSEPDPTYWMPLPSSPEDQQKAAATPTIADPDGESGR